MRTRYKIAAVAGGLAALLAGIALAGYRHHSAPSLLQDTALLSVWDLQRIGEPVPDGISEYTYGLALSPDRQWIATLGLQLQIWDARSGKPAGQPLALSGGAVAWSPDGGTLAAGTDNGNVVLARADSGQVLWQTAIGTKTISALAYSPDGKYIAASSYSDNIVRVLNPSGKLVCQGQPAHLKPVSGLVFAEGGKALVSSGQDGALRIWDPATCKELRPQIQGQKQFFGILALHPDGRVVAVATVAVQPSRELGSVEFWDIGTGKMAAAPIKGYGGTYGVGGMAFSADGAMLMVGDRSGALSYVDWKTGKVIAHGMARHDAVIVWSTVFSPKGDLVATAGKDHILGIWSAHLLPASRSPLALTKATTYPFDAARLAFSGDGKTVALAQKNHVVVRETGSDKPLLDVTLNFSGGFSLSRNGQWLAANDRNVYLWNIPRKQLVGKWDNFGAESLAFNAEGTRLAIGSFGGVTLIDCRTGQVLAKQNLGGGPNIRIVRLAFDPAGKLLLAVDPEGNVYRFNADTLQPAGAPWQGFGLYGAIAFSADGSRVALTRKLRNGESFQAVVLNVASSEQLSPPMTANLGMDHALAFTPDGNHLLMAGSNGTVSLWDSVNGQRIALTNSGSQGYTHGVMLTPDLRRLYSCGNAFGSDLHTDCWIWGVSLNLPPAAASQQAATAAPVGLSPIGNSLQVELRSLSNAIDQQTTGLTLEHDKALTVFLNSGNLRAQGVLDANDKNIVVYGDSALSPDGSLVTVPLNGEQLAIYDYRSGKLLHVMEKGGIHTFLQGGELALYRGARYPGDQNPDAPAIVVVDPATGNTLRTLDFPAHDYATRLAAGSKTPVIVIGTSEGELLFGHADAGAAPFKVMKDMHRGAVSALAFSADERLVASGGIDGRVRIFDAQTGEPVGTPWTGQGPAVSALAFNADASLLASGSSDGTIRLWNTRTGQPVSIALLAHGQTIHTLWFDPASGRLLTWDGGNTLRMWAPPQVPGRQAGR